MSTTASGDPAREPIGVFVLDDHEIVRKGGRGLLEAEPDIRVIGEAGTATDALASIAALRPGVAVLDVRLPDGGPPPGTGIRAGENGPRAAGDPGGHSGEPLF